jgi:putative ATP-dependent endonuclease of the OLD family
VYREKFEKQLTHMSSELNRVVESYSPGRLVRVVPSDVELKPPRTTFAVSVFDGETETAVDRQGHGFQRTLLISALQLLAQSGAAETEGTICLAIEEPELFQHPIQAQAFAKVLRVLAEDPTKRIQVAYATHSPYFVDGSKFSQIRRLTRADGAVPRTQVAFSTVDRVKGILAGTIKPEIVERQLNGIVSDQLSVAIFANRALLVEGTTEVSVILGIADRSSAGRLETLGVAVVGVCGKTNIPLVHAILTSLGIPTHSMFDGDAGFEDRARANGKNPGKIEQERKSHIAANRANLRYFRLAEADFPPETVAPSVTILEDHLEALMDRDWPEWGVSCSRLEDELGIILGKNSVAYRKATLEAGGNACSLLAGVVEKAIGA